MEEVDNRLPLFLRANNCVQVAPICITMIKTTWQGLLRGHNVQEVKTFLIVPVKRTKIAKVVIIDSHVFLTQTDLQDQLGYCIVSSEQVTSTKKKWLRSFGSMSYST